MSRHYYEKCSLCDGAGCHFCERTGFLKTGITAAQVERLAKAATRLDFEEGDIVELHDRRHVDDPKPFLAIVISVGAGLVYAEVVNPPHTRIGTTQMNCRRLGNIHRTEGQPC